MSRKRKAKTIFPNIVEIENGNILRGKRLIREYHARGGYHRDDYSHAELVDLLHVLIKKLAKNDQVADVNWTFPWQA